MASVPTQRVDPIGDATRARAWQSQPNQDARIDSRTWFDGPRRVIEIDHHGTIYRLRCTAQGKLILTK